MIDRENQPGEDEGEAEGTAATGTEDEAANEDQADAGDGEADNQGKAADTQTND